MTGILYGIGVGPGDPELMTLKAVKAIIDCDVICLPKAYKNKCMAYLIAQEAYDTLGLATFFTAGEKECRAWTFKKGMKAPECAGIIHSDFEKGFIRAEVIGYSDFLEYGSPLKAKEAGKMRSEGKEYVFQDGDIVLFRFNN